ncbi:hypothetical protein CBR_g41042 [Chara braunii]|uniref:Flotillin-like n=1 Tax=Chara braunii TaxID=69332 RepID=A0A388LUZ7_CHABU|nr:hypothetical protein CBR_g41042 [Chara braunii]|eukprot:GBG86138.1 hypothetical protein CBR_g41042 [Chara braunii]
MMYRIADASQFYVLTGAGIDDVKVYEDGAAIVLPPFRKSIAVQRRPQTFTMDIKAMSLEKLEFVGTAMCTVGPWDTFKGIEKYTKLFGTAMEDNPDFLRSIVHGILEGEIRAMSASLTMDQIHSEWSINMGNKAAECLKEDLHSMGLHLYSCNFKTLQDVEGSEYFKIKRERKKAEAEMEASSPGGCSCQCRREAGAAAPVRAGVGNRLFLACSRNPVSVPES